MSATTTVFTEGAGAILVSGLVALRVVFTLVRTLVGHCCFLSSRWANTQGGSGSAGWCRCGQPEQAAAGSPRRGGRRDGALARSCPRLCKRGRSTVPRVGGRVLRRHFGWVDNPRAGRRARIVSRSRSRRSRRRRDGRGWLSLRFRCPDRFRFHFSPIEREKWKTEKRPFLTVSEKR